MKIYMYGKILNFIAVTLHKIEFSSWYVHENLYELYYNNICLYFGGIVNRLLIVKLSRVLKILRLTLVMFEWRLSSY